MQWVRPAYSTSRGSARKEVRALKRRRDELLNLSLNRQERPRVMNEVQEINRRIRQLEAASGRR